MRAAGRVGGELRVAGARWSVGEVRGAGDWPAGASDRGGLGWMGCGCGAVAREDGLRGRVRDRWLRGLVCRGCGWMGCGCGAVARADGLRGRVSGRCLRGLVCRAGGWLPALADGTVCGGAGDCTGYCFGAEALAGGAARVVVPMPSVEGLG